MEVIQLEKDSKFDNQVFYEAGHIFHHYLEKSIPAEEWERMPVEEALGIAKDVAALLAWVYYKILV